jgi:hypothetical protein
MGESDQIDLHNNIMNILERKRLKRFKFNFGIPLFYQRGLNNDTIHIFSNHYNFAVKIFIDQDRYVEVKDLPEVQHKGNSQFCKFTLMRVIINEGSIIISSSFIQ